MATIDTLPSITSEPTFNHTGRETRFEYTRSDKTLVNLSIIHHVILAGKETLPRLMIGALITMRTISAVMSLRSRLNSPLQKRGSCAICSTGQRCRQYWTRSKLFASSKAGPGTILNLLFLFTGYRRPHLYQKPLRPQQ